MYVAAAIGRGHQGHRASARFQRAECVPPRVQALDRDDPGPISRPAAELDRATWSTSSRASAASTVATSSASCGAAAVIPAVSPFASTTSACARRRPADPNRGYNGGCGLSICRCRSCWLRRAVIHQRCARTTWRRRRCASRHAMPRLVHRLLARLAITVPTAATVTPTATSPPTRARPARCAIQTASAWTPTRAAGSGATSSTAASRACPRRRSPARSTRRTERCRCTASTSTSRRPPSGPLTRRRRLRSLQRRAAGQRRSRQTITDEVGHFTLNNVPVGDEHPARDQERQVAPPDHDPERRRVRGQPARRRRHAPAEEQERRRHPEDRDHDRQRRLARVPLRKIGIADSEITTDGGDRRVHLYAGNGADQFAAGFAGGTGAFSDGRRRSGRASTSSRTTTS